MRPDGVRRSVRGRKHERAAGDAPSLDHVGRMPGLGLPKRKRRRKKLRESLRFQRRGKIAKSWTYLLAALALVLLGATVMGAMYWQKMARPEIPVASASLPVLLPKATGFPSPSETVALAFVSTALATRDPAVAGEMFRADVGFLEIVDFLKSVESGEGKPKGLEWLGNMDVNGLQVDGVMVNFETSGLPSYRLALLTPDASGKWMIDFDAFSRRVSPSWEDLLARQAGVARVRVHARPENYYNGVFTDETKWSCYGLSSPDFEGLLMAYSAKSSSKGDAMNAIFSKGVSPVRVTLEIRRVEGADSRQFEIVSVLAEDWIVGKRPFDSDFE